MYHVCSSKASEFINHEEILETLSYAKKHQKNTKYIETLIERAENGEGLTHREAAVLLECSLPDLNEKIYQTAKKIKQKLYGNRIVIFAPLYVSNYCVNGCLYCPYHAGNKKIRRRKLSQQEIEKETVALQKMGHKRLALEAGEDSQHNSIEYILESIRTIYAVKQDLGAIRRVNVNIAATTVENYKKLKEAGIGTYILFQETYHKETYERLHPTGPKSDYAYHTEAMDRAMEAGIDDVGCGVLFGLYTYRYDFVGLLMHAEHLEARFGVGPHTISVPRLCPADTMEVLKLSHTVAEKTFEKIVAVLRLALPYTGMILSTRESPEMRKKLLKLGITQISAGSKTSVGGYAEEKEDNSSAQFQISDRRTLDETVEVLLKEGYLPSFCTACYREGRTGTRFMFLLKAGKIANRCHLNALMTLKEYLEDYALKPTKEEGRKRLQWELNQISDVNIREVCRRNLEKIEAGQRDFRF